MAKTKTPTEEKFDKQDFNLFEALTAIDKKDYGYYDRLTDEQKKKFSPYVLIQYLSSVKGSKDLQTYYLQSVDYHSNKYILDSTLNKKDSAHPKLQWLMLCASSPGLGSQFHPWIPSLKERCTKFKDKITLKEVKDFYKKVYPKSDDQIITEISQAYTSQQNKRYRLAQIFPTMKISDIEILSESVTEEELDKYEEERTF